MITRSTTLQLLAFALLTVLGTSYVGATYVGLDDALLGRGYTVSVDLAESGGIFENAEVTYRGVTVGRVEGLRLSDDGVLVDLRIEDERPIPADLDLVVENRSAVGEQYVDLQPRSSDGPYLEQGDVVPRERTRTPLATEDLLLDTDRFVRSVDREDLATVVEELGDAFASGGRDLQRLLDAGDQLTLSATQALPETIRLVEDGAVVLDTQRETGPQIRSALADFADVQQTIRERDGDLRLLLDRGAVATSEVEALLTENRPALAGLFTNLVTVGEVTVARVDGLEQILITYPDVVTGGYTVVPGDGTAHFGLVAGSEPPACTRGYESTQKTSPSRTSGLPPLNTGVRCAEPRGSAVTVRGAQNAPRPTSASAAPARGLPTSVPLLRDGLVLSPGAAGSLDGGSPVVRTATGSGLSGAAALTALLTGGTAAPTSAAAPVEDR